MNYLELIKSKLIENNCNIRLGSIRGGEYEFNHKKIIYSDILFSVGVSCNFDFEYDLFRMNKDIKIVMVDPIVSATVQLGKGIAKFGLKIGRRIKRLIFNPDKFLKDISGVVHIGANLGQERERYNNYGLSVIWVEPIPDVYERLKENIKSYNNQLAFQALITDVDDNNYEFHIANNDGASSSIYELKHHKDIWPDINYQKSISIKSITLTSLFKKKSIDIAKYQALIMDTQGSELLVLKGSIPILNRFKYVKTEVADFESYARCCQLPEMVDFMTEHGFQELSRTKFAQRTEGV